MKIFQIQDFQSRNLQIEVFQRQSLQESSKNEAFNYLRIQSLKPSKFKTFKNQGLQKLKS